MGNYDKYFGDLCEEFFSLENVGERIGQCYVPDLPTDTEVPSTQESISKHNYTINLIIRLVQSSSITEFQPNSCLWIYQISIISGLSSSRYCTCFLILDYSWRIFCRNSFRLTFLQTTLISNFTLHFL